jgi:acetoin utilization deacetylase AcuC-like enzyme
MEVVSHEAFSRLHPTGAHPESGVRLAVLNKAFEGFVQAEPAEVRDVRRCHELALVERLQAVDGPTWLDADTPVSETTFDAALLAAGAAIEAVRREGFAVLRPPGHHATPTRAMGFCIFNNAAVAARWAQAELGIERVAIVDWDVHHGNGTQDIFWDDPSVLYVSLHQWPYYPGTGGPEEQNETTLNLPMPAGQGDREYLAAFDEAIERKVRRFDPGLLIVSAGFDNHVDDPLADMEVTAAGFREMARRCSALAPRVAAVLEGGYNPGTLPGLVESALAGFASET